MDRGRVVADGTPAAIVDELGGAPTVRFTDAELDVRPPAGPARRDDVRRHGPEVRVEGRGPLLAHVGAHLVAIGRPALDLRVDRPSLEDRFVALTKEAARSDRRHRHPRHARHRAPVAVRTVAQLTRTELRLLRPRAGRRSSA